MNVQKAGCVLLDLNNKKIGLVYRKKQNDYSFSKGHLEPGETLEECAIRETEEETGKRCLIIPSKALPILTYVDSQGDEAEVYYYLASDEGPSPKIFDSELAHDLVWISPDEMEHTLSYPNLIAFWHEIEPIVNKEFKKREKE